MRRLLLALPLLLGSGWVHAQSGDCGALVKPQSMPVQPTLLPSLAPELAIPSHQLGAPTCICIDVVHGMPQPLQHGTQGPRHGFCAAFGSQA